MNPLSWGDAVQRLQRNVHPSEQNCINMGNASSTNNECDPYCEYSRYTANEPHNTIEVNVDWEDLNPSSHNFCNMQPEFEDPDGEMLEMNNEDPELARKRQELKEIEEQIMQKKVALALKTVEPILMKTTPGFSGNQQLAACNGETLQDRVKRILQQRHSLSFLKVQSPKEKTNFARLRKDGLLREDHPLKLRVKSLMKQRYSDPRVLSSTIEVPHAKRPLLSQNSCLSAREENSADKGFQRFLSVLNKGVDMDLLSRIVNDDSEDLPLGEEVLRIQLPAAENKSDLPFRSENQQSNSGAVMPGPSQTSSGGGNAEQQSQERSHDKIRSSPDDWEKNDRRYGSFGSSSRSKSPPTAKEEEEKPKVDEQREQLQYILKTLGLNLEVEEMSKLADRTQERLYGKKHEGRDRTDSRGQQRSHLRASHRHYSNSSSSSFSSSSSSRSTSRSFSPSPSRLQRSRSRDSKQRRTPEHSRSRGSSRSRKRSEGRDVNQEAREAVRPSHGDKDKSDYQHPPHQTYAHPHTNDFSSFQHYTSQYSQCTAYHSDNYSASKDSYWTYPQGAIPPSGFPILQNPYHQFPRPLAPPNLVYPHHKNWEDMSFFLNPDLSTSEGQIGSASGLRCLQVISTKESPQKKCIKQLTNGCKRRGNKKKYMNRRRLFLERRKEERIKKKQQQMVVSQSPLLNVEVSSQVKEAEQPEEVKRELTEEEIKANLRKKLEAFNQKVKQQVARPVAQPDASFTG
ncbi:pinin-like [Channa argus]|uniref:pinin-like n=1 Tax=Channa argus TaxID=215402 RepID=UPI00294876C3|nr:hypothetical protein Q8A73_003847 [Channa argus]